MADFVARVDEINRLAESCPGYLWRYTGASEAGTLAPLAPYLDPFEPDRPLFNCRSGRIPKACGTLPEEDL